MGSAFHQLCSRYSGTLTPTAPTAIWLWDTFTFTFTLWLLRWPKRLTFRIHTTSQFRIPKFSSTNLGIRNREVYVMWASGNR